MQPNGYKFIHKPKVSGLHGGVAFYIKDTLNDEICDRFFIEISLASKGTHRNGKVILGNIYRPSRDNVDNYNSFTLDIDRSVSTFQNSSKVIILGDFNIDLMKLNEKEHVNFPK